MSKRFLGKVAIVTGSTRGMGVQIARRLGEEGADVVVTGRSSQLGADVVQGITDASGSAVFIEADLSETSEVRRLIRDAVAHFGGLHVLVNNAAPIDVISQSDKPVISETEADFEAIMRVGLYAAVTAVKEALPTMLEGGGGAIVNISSTAGVQAVPGVPAYSAMKGALQSFSRQIAGDYGRQGVRSNCIIAGPILTDSLIGMALRHPAVAAAFQQVLLTKDGRLGEPDDVAHAVLYLASDEAKFVNGVFLPVDGGSTANTTLPDVSQVFAEATAGTGA